MKLGVATCIRRHGPSAFLPAVLLFTGCNTVAPPVPAPPVAKSSPPTLSTPSRRPATAAEEVVRLEPVLVPYRPGPAFPTGATLPQPLSRARPVYPPLLRQHRVEGEAAVAFVVSADGIPENVVCVQATDRRFAEAAVDAVRAWRFSPATLAGKPVSMPMQVPILFSLNESGGTPGAPPDVRPTRAITVPLSGGLTGDAARDREWLLSLRASQVPPQFARGSDAYYEWLQERNRKLHDFGLEYLSRYENDPRRWDILVLLQYGRNDQVQVRRDGSKQLVPDVADRESWNRKYYPWLEQLVADPDASLGTRAEALRQLISQAAFSVRRGDAGLATTLPPKVLAWLERYERENPTSGAMSSLYRTVAMMFNAIDPLQCARFLREKRAAHATDHFIDVQLRQDIDRVLRLVQGQEEPVPLLWEQLQGFAATPFDVSFYRGKVVLIAWLAVDWSSRTMELEELYRKYHDAGFEIIQVAYYNGNRSAPPEQRDRSAMERFVGAKGWPWRVVWDPKESFQESFAQFWGMDTIPSLFVIARDGRIARQRAGRLTLDAQIADELARAP